LIQHYVYQNQLDYVQLILLHHHHHPLATKIKITNKYRRKLNLLLRQFLPVHFLVEFYFFDDEFYP
jgi:hypothetical protein